MTNKSKYNEEYIRTAAYYNWKNAGCPCGNDEYFWNMAINQLYGSCSCSSKSCSSSKKTSSSKSKTTTSTSSKSSASTSKSSVTSKTTSKK